MNETIEVAAFLLVAGGAFALVDAAVRRVASAIRIRRRLKGVGR